jgi:hypothetical protein
MPLLIECLLVLIAIVVAFLFPNAGERQFGLVESAFARLAKRRRMVVVAAGVGALALRAALLPVLPIPEPVIHDEFGYLLAADTFAHGRLTNPTHPMWVYFETFSILQQPTYQCFAQPAQGLILAFGKLVFGHPFWGVWLSAGLMCAAITWMLQGWLAPPWALLGGILAILRYGVFGYWANSYWGGCIGAIGGALVIGSLPRIKSLRRVRDAVLMGLGLAVLANSRPYEGFILGLATAILLLAWLLGRNKAPLGMSLGRVIFPLAVVLALTAACLGYYCRQVTGSPFRMPYQVNRETYAIAPFMVWQPLRQDVPVYRYDVLQKLYVGEELGDYHMSRSLTGIILKTYVAWHFYLAAALSLPLLMLVIVLPPNLCWRNVQPATGSLLFVLVAMIAASAASTFYNPHYSAPATGVILALVLIAMRNMRNWSRRGIFLTRAVLVISIFTFGMRAAAEGLHVRPSKSAVFAWYQEGLGTFGRAQVESELSRIPGKHLVIVHYGPQHEPFPEWVYNAADIDGASIVWAREQAKGNADLIQYFKDRQAWLLDADSKPPRLAPFDSDIHRRSAQTANPKAEGVEEFHP